MYGYEYKKSIFVDRNSIGQEGEPDKT